MPLFQCLCFVDLLCCVLLCFVVSIRHSFLNPTNATRRPSISLPDCRFPRLLKSRPHVLGEPSLFPSSLVAFPSCQSSRPTRTNTHHKKARRRRSDNSGGRSLPRGARCRVQPAQGRSVLSLVPKDFQGAHQNASVSSFLLLDLSRATPTVLKRSLQVCKVQPELLPRRRKGR